MACHASAYAFFVYAFSSASPPMPEFARIQGETRALTELAAALCRPPQ
jgi:hypothetical protein